MGRQSPKIGGRLKSQRPTGPASLRLEKSGSAEFSIARFRPVCRRTKLIISARDHPLQCLVRCQSHFKVDAIFPDLAKRQSPLLYLTLDTFAAMILVSVG
jgi:hypothetical protein